ncbi:sulfatase-like hydrolase/transferase [Lacipirellula sp.]|uniref:sulfatase-like hydrolase/transferase n=1 Tax=Lacipirellula sp. TaxID=2691419 RepID=UPI003D0AB7B6
MTIFSAVRLAVTTFARPAISLAILSVLAFSSIETASAQPAAPNIIVMIMDDLSWNGLSVLMDPNVPNSKSDFYQTPHIAALAQSGMRFSNGYAPTSMCSPTRAALLTGKSPGQLQQTELKDAQPGTPRYMGSFTGLPLTPPTPEFFDPNELTMPRIVKQANPNYTTGLIGKWHLDIPASVTPIASGFDYYKDVGVPSQNVDPWGLEALANEANIFMSQSVASGKPFLMEYAAKAPHPPIYAKPETVAKYAALPKGAVHSDPNYAAMIEHMDTTVGMVLDKVQQLGIADNTYILFTSDHGAALNLSSGYPLRGGKSSILEGGVRVPYFASGPGIAANTFSDLPVTTMDIFSTVASWAGYTGPVPQGVEGADLNVVLKNGGVLPAGVDHLERQYSQGGEIYVHQPQYMAVGTSSRLIPASFVRDGDYKLYRQYGENGAADRYFLYNLKTDIGEAVNIANQNPTIVADLKGKLNTYLAAIDASFAYDVKTNINLTWNAETPGVDTTLWRSLENVDYKARESWTINAGGEAPTRAAAERYQANLSKAAFNFDGGDGMNTRFFHVSDPTARTTTLNPGTNDFDRSMSAQVWFRVDDMQGSGILMESGDGTNGMSLTLGNADGVGGSNDLRFRVLGANGEALTLDVPIDRFADPTKDFIQATAVYNDSNTDRYLQLYINGALAGQINGQLGEAHSLQWDGYDRAGLGNVGGEGLGAAGGTGVQPFTGGFRGEMASAKFTNYALTPTSVLANYNSALAPTMFGIKSFAGGATTATQRPSSVAKNASEAATVRIYHERSDRLDASLTLDAGLSANVLLRNGTPGTPAQLAAGTLVSSYLFQLDPVGTSGSSINTTGTVNFNQIILGILFDDASLAGTDKILGSIGDYGVASDRGLTFTGSGATGDFIRISADRMSITYRLTAAGDQMQQFRIITGFTGPGDFNGDGIVNSADLSVWKTAFGTSAAGDANGDGVTDGADFMIWQRNNGTGVAYGSTVATSVAATPAVTASVSAVPEPSSLAMVAIGLATTAVGVARKRGSCSEKAA